MFDARGSGIECGKIGDVGGDRQCAPSQPPQFGRSVLEASHIAGDQGDIVAPLGKRHASGPPDTGACTGDHHDL